MASRFGTGFQAGANLRLGQQEQRRKALEQEQKRTAQLTKDTNEAIKGVMEFATEFTTQFQTGKSNLTVEQFQENLNNIINTVLRTSQLATQRGLPVMTPEMIEAQRATLLKSATQQQVAAREGAAEGTKEVTSATVQAQALGGTPKEQQRDVRRLLGADGGAQTTKAVFNTETGKMQFATDDEIKANPNLVPTQTGTVTIQDIVVPLLQKVQTQGTQSLNDDEWATLELAARQSGVDVQINRRIRDALATRADAVAPEEIKTRFANDKSVPQGSKLGMKTDQGYEVLDKDGNLIGYYE